MEIFGSITDPDFIAHLRVDVVLLWYIVIVGGGSLGQFENGNGNGRGYYTTEHRAQSKAQSHSHNSLHGKGNLGYLLILKSTWFFYPTVSK